MSELPNRLDHMVHPPTMTVAEKAPMGVDWQRPGKPNAFVKNKMFSSPWFTDSQSLHLEQNYMGIAVINLHKVDISDFDSCHLKGAGRGRVEAELHHVGTVGDVIGRVRVTFSATQVNNRVVW